MAPPGAAHLNYSMAGLVLVGGIAGFAAKRSMPSLLAGIGSAALYGYSAFLIGENPKTGFELGTATSVVLAAAMSRRAIASGKVFPAGVVALAAVGAGVYNGKKALEWR
eukprot:comp23792_c0_seq1/m.41304 comp23792_c0_seq1/g.41304  ORF comp23792_c0_seq1/g.41304 comp23792_c0_seq1/m.41304 type:complete len:109 (-) comp23792_c0_seq1:24-350(-)